MHPTKEQTRAINTRAPQILISAAAGSGKTAVLVQRILSLLSEGKDIDRLLIVTFTEAAAAEMKERISEALTKSLETETNSKKLLHLMRQTSRLPAASISTIHAFCLRLVKDHFHILNLDPAFRVGDQTELSLLQSQIMESLFEESYEKIPAFDSLVETFGGGKTRDVRLDELIRRLFDFIESQPFPEESVKRYLNINFSDYITIIKEELAVSLSPTIQALNRACELCRLPDGPEKYLVTLYEDEALIKRLLFLIESGASLEEIHKNFTESSFGRIHTYRGKEKDLINDDLRQQAKDIRDKEIKKRFDNIKKRFLFASPAKMQEDVKRLQPIIKSLFNLTLEYRARYSAEKQARNLVDFSDLEHYTIKILSDPQVIAKYDEVLIDEYQDINEVQEWILSAVKTPSRFMVGDVKQSIYGFRHAQPKLFVEKYKNPDIQSIVLSKNFRSRPSVLDSVNFFFRHLMTEGDIVYDDEAALYPGLEFPQSGNYTTELHVADAAPQEEDEEKSEIKIRQEARLIAKRIHELVGQNQYRYGDIVVLTRSIRSVAAVLTEELKQQGINAVAESPGGFFGTPEIMTALSLLRVIDNPRQDIDLLAVLRLRGFSADDMLRIRLNSNNKDFYDCLLAYAGLDTRVAELLADIERWRKKAVVLPISRLIGLIYEDCQLLYRYGAMPGGAVRQANLRLLLEKAIQYESTSFSGLFHFVRYAEWLQSRSEDDAAMLIPDDDSLVRVMTIHKSKGLEFPVVFVSQLGRQFNKMDERAGVVLHPKLGLGAMYTDLELRTRSNTIPRLALSLLRQREAVAEELRVLYVAMTRAKEKLILTGCLTNLPEKLEQWKLFSLREAKNYLDWLMPWVLEGSEHVKLTLHYEALEAGDMAFEETIPKMQKRTKKPPSNELPSKLAISELKRIYALETSPDSTAYEHDDIFEAPQFYREASGKIDPLRMGTILHTVVEHIDLNRDTNAAAIKTLISSLATKGLLSQEEAQAVDISKLEGFINSPLAERMRKAKHLHREVPFVIGLKPQEIYPEEKSEDAILVHGIIDCYFETAEGEIVLVDFKSDARPETLHRRYATQMKIYRRAIEQATGKPVAESLFYSFA